MTSIETKQTHFYDEENEIVIASFDGFNRFEDLKKIVVTSAEQIKKRGWDAIIADTTNAKAWPQEFKAYMQEEGFPLLILAGAKYSCVIDSNLATTRLGTKSIEKSAKGPILNHTVKCFDEALQWVKENKIRFNKSK